MDLSKNNIKAQQLIVGTSLLLFIVKVIAYYLTNSVAILTDALESTVNIIASLIGLYSLNLSAKPPDEEHPYGHGKIEFISSGIEGAMILFAGLVIIYEGIDNFIHPHNIQAIDYGIVLIFCTALINFFVGFYSISVGKRNNSLPLVSSGQHLLSDTYSTVGILIGLILVYFTKWSWLDNLIGILFGIFIGYTGLKIIRTSVAGIMDESDKKLIEEIIFFIQQYRKPTWIDLHNLRIIKYGSLFHIDAHITLPYYFTVYQAHLEVKEFESLIQSKYGSKIELFIHIDDCKDFSCEICNLTTCTKRIRPFKKMLEWNFKNCSYNNRHAL